MALPQMISLAEAAAFTIGCAVLNARKFDPERIGIVLTMLIAALFFALVIVVTATNPIEVAVPGPDEVFSVLE